MSKKGLGIVLVCCLASLSIWYVVWAVIEVYNYTQWQVRSKAVVNHWEVVELKGDQFVVSADYEYVYQGKNYKNHSQVGGVYPNPWAAHEAKDRFAQQTWSVWLNAQHPEKSVFEKVFPIKRTLSALVLLGIALYFAVLCVYLRAKHG